MAIDGAGQAGICDLHRLLLAVPESTGHHHILSVQPALIERFVARIEDGCGGRFIGRRAADQPADQGGVERGGRAFSADVPQHDTGARRPVAEKIIHIAADGVRGVESGRDLRAWHTRTTGRQKMMLYFARHRQITLHALLFFGQAFIEAGIFNRGGDLGAERADDADVVLGEVSAACMLQVQHTDHFILVDERDHQLRPGLRIQVDVTRIFAYIRDHDRLTLLRGGSHQAASDRDVVLEMYPLFEAQRKPVDQLCPGLVEQKNGEPLLVDDLEQQVANTLQQLVNIQNRGKLAADLVEQRERVCLTDNPRLEARLFHAHGNARGHQRKHARVFILEVVAHRGLNVDHANDAVLVDQRDSQLGAGAGNGFNVIAVLGDIIHQDDAALFHRPSGDAFADFDAGLLRDLRRIADLKAEPQLLRAFVQQQNGKNLIVNDALDHLRYALQQGIQIERGVEHVSHFDENRLNVNMLWRSGRCSHAIQTSNDSRRDLRNW